MPGWDLREEIRKTKLGSTIPPLETVLSLPRSLASDHSYALSFQNHGYQHAMVTISGPEKGKSCVLLGTVLLPWNLHSVRKMLCLYSPALGTPRWALHVCLSWMLGLNKDPHGECSHIQSSAQQLHILFIPLVHDPRSWNPLTIVINRCYVAAVRLYLVRHSCWICSRGETQCMGVTGGL